MDCPNCARMERLLSQALLNTSSGDDSSPSVAPISEGYSTAPPKKKRSSAYSRKYKSAFKKISKKYKLKNGKWKKNGFRLAVKHAHRIAGGKK